MLPLDHLLVVDLTAFRSGPTAVRQLADWGARVITVERPPAPSDSGGTSLGSRLGSDFQNLRRNNESLTLDLKQTAGRDLFLRLVARADVLVENFKTGTLEKWGLGWDTLSERFARLVHCRDTGLESTGCSEIRVNRDHPCIAREHLHGGGNNVAGGVFLLGIDDG